ncbi:MAG: hypothetical protein OCC49_00535 [Fibrobacterales bacterium]
MACCVIVGYCNSLPVDTIRVGGYVFPPYIEADYKTGFTFDYIALLNKSQSKFHFTFLETSAKRRYGDIINGNIDLILFEDIQWGWARYDVLSSSLFHIGSIPYNDADLFVALHSETKNNSFCKTLKGKSLLLTFGYHYVFAENITDRQILQKRFNASLSRNPNEVIKKLLLQRGDIAVISQSLLQKFIGEYPEHKNSFRVCDKKDYEYNMRAVFSAQSKKYYSSIVEIIEHLNRSGEFLTLLKKKHLVK